MPTTQHILVAIETGDRPIPADLASDLANALAFGLSEWGGYADAHIAKVAMAPTVDTLVGASAKLDAANDEPDATAQEKMIHGLAWDDDLKRLARQMLADLQTAPVREREA